MHPALHLGIKLELPGVAAFGVVDAHSELLEVKGPQSGKFCEDSSPALLSACLAFIGSDSDVEMEILHRLQRKLGSISYEWKNCTHTVEADLISPVEDWDGFRSNLVIECQHGNGRWRQVGLSP